MNEKMNLRVSGRIKEGRGMNGEITNKSMDEWRSDEQSEAWSAKPP